MLLLRFLSVIASSILITIESYGERNISSVSPYDKNLGQTKKTKTAENREAILQKWEKEKLLKGPKKVILDAVLARPVSEENTGSYF